jgi:DNA-binding NarL/FixJ family response regulator
MSRRVVLVDDTPDVRALVKMALERRGDFAVVGEASDGVQGLRVADELQPDVVLLDIAMPVMDGLEALPLIRAACPGATVIMLSAFGAEQMVQRALDAGADGYVQKGISISALLARVRELSDAGPAAPGLRHLLPETVVHRPLDEAAARPHDGPLARWHVALARAWRRVPALPAPGPVRVLLVAA